MNGGFYMNNFKAKEVTYLLKRLYEDIDFQLIAKLTLKIEQNY